VPVRPGEDWGIAGGLPDDGVVVRSDAEARAVVERARRARVPVPPLGLLGGDLCRTLGGTGDEGRIRSPEGRRVPIDLGTALVDGRRTHFVAHLVVRQGWWRGRIVAVMNAQFLGDWDVAPRGHPNDGRLDVLDVAAAMPLGQRWQARSRLRAGTHVPHPDISQRRTAALQIDLERATPVRLDGELVGPARSLSVRVEPDALLCVV
jgi:hypothetical protein